MMKNVNLTEKKLEICAGSYEDCRTAWEAGADRVELNSSKIALRASFES